MKDSDHEFPDALDALADAARLDRHFDGQMNVTAVSRHIGRGMATITLYRLLDGERELRPQHMEIVAAAFDVEPTYFAEYRLWLARKSFDPALVGWEEALSHLYRWEQSEGRRRS